MLNLFLKPQQENKSKCGAPRYILFSEWLLHTPKPRSTISHTPQARLCIQLSQIQLVHSHAASKEQSGSFKAEVCRIDIGNLANRNPASPSIQQPATSSRQRKKKLLPIKVRLTSSAFRAIATPSNPPRPTLRVRSTQ